MAIISMSKFERAVAACYAVASVVAVTASSELAVRFETMDERAVDALGRMARERGLETRTREGRGGRWTVTVYEPMLDRLASAASEVYQRTGNDIWGERVPSKVNYLDCIGDQMANGATNAHEELTAEELAVWLALPKRLQRVVMLSVGP